MSASDQLERWERMASYSITDRAFYIRSIAVALHEACAEVRRLEDQLSSYRLADAGNGSRIAFIEQAKEAIRNANTERDEVRAEVRRLRETLTSIRNIETCDLIDQANRGRIVDLVCPSCLARQALGKEPG